MISSLEPAIVQEEVLHMLEKDLLPNVADPETRVFYLKMRAEAVAELSVGDLATECTWSAMCT